MQSRYACSSCQEDFNEEDKLPQILECGHDLCKKCCFGQFIGTQKVICPQCQTLSPDFLKLPVNKALSQEISLKKSYPYSIPSSCQFHQQEQIFYCEQDQIAFCEECQLEGKHQAHRVLKIEEVTGHLMQKALYELRQVKLVTNKIKRLYNESQQLKESTNKKSKDFIQYAKKLSSEKICYITNQSNTLSSNFRNQADALVKYLDQKINSWDSIKKAINNQHFQIPNNPYHIIGLLKNFSEVMQWELVEVQEQPMIQSLKTKLTITSEEQIQQFQDLKNQQEINNQIIENQDQEIRTLQNEKQGFIRKINQLEQLLKGQQEIAAQEENKKQQAEAKMTKENKQLRNQLKNLEDTLAESQKKLKQQEQIVDQLLQQSTQQKQQEQRKIQIQEEELKAQQKLQRQEQQKQQQKQLQYKKQEQIGCQVKSSYYCSNESNQEPCPKCQKKGCTPCFMYQRNCKTCNKKGQFCFPCYRECYEKGHQI